MDMNNSPPPEAHPAAQAEAVMEDVDGPPGQSESAAPGIAQLATKKNLKKAKTAKTGCKLLCNLFDCFFAE